MTRYFMQKNLHFIQQRGFTIVELLVAISIFSLLIFVTMVMLQNVLIDTHQQFSALDNVDHARLVTSEIVNELRNATVGADGSYQINTAGDNQLIFYSTPSGGGPVNRVNYYLSGTTLWKGVTAPTGNPQVYNTALEIKAIVQNDVVNTAPIFTYYNGNYTGSGNPLPQPVNVNFVKFVKINLDILKQVQKQNPSIFSISAGSNIRNLKNNLGD